MVTELNILNLAFRPLSDEDDKEKIDIGEGDEEVVPEDGAAIEGGDDPDEDEDGPGTVE